MWQVKIPKRNDFCGCPPCPLCYIWGDDLTQDLVDGIQKMKDDLLEISKPKGFLGERKLSSDEEKAIEDAAELIHARNLESNLIKPPDSAAEAEAYDERMQREVGERQLAGILKQTRTQKTPVIAKPVLDHMDLSEVAKKVELEKGIEEKEKDLSMRRQAQDELQREVDMGRMSMREAQATYQSWLADKNSLASREAMRYDYANLPIQGPRKR